jgi:hypothetical protein
VKLNFLTALHNLILDICGVSAIKVAKYTGYVEENGLLTSVLMKLGVKSYILNTAAFLPRDVEFLGSGRTGSLWVRTAAVDVLNMKSPARGDR